MDVVNNMLFKKNYFTKHDQVFHTKMVMNIH